MTWLNWLLDRRYWIGGTVAAAALVVAVFTAAVNAPGDRDLATTTGYAALLAGGVLTCAAILDYVRARHVLRALAYVQKHPQHLAGFLADSHPRTNLERELTVALDQIWRSHADALREQTDAHQFALALLTQWAHAMKTPLAVLRLLTDRPVGTVSEGDSVWLDDLRHEHNRIAAEVERMLYALRVDHIHIDARPESIDLTPLVREVINERKRDFIHSNHFPRLMADAELTVHTDAKWLRFIISQLLDNALKYSLARHGKTGTSTAVTLAIGQAAGAALLQVRDEGIGIPPTDLPHVYEPFFTGDNGRTCPASTGLGLYLCKRAATDLGLELAIESTVGVGTTATLRIPLDHAYTHIARNVTNL